LFIISSRSLKHSSILLFRTRAPIMVAWVLAVGEDMVESFILTNTKSSAALVTVPALQSASMEVVYVKLPGVWPSWIISSKTFIPLVGFRTPHQRKNSTLIVISISIRLNLVLHRLKQCTGILDQTTLAWSIQQVKGIHFRLHLTLIFFFLSNFWTRSDTSRYNSSKWLTKPQQEPLSCYSSSSNQTCHRLFETAASYISY